MKRTPDSDELTDGQVDLGGSCSGLVCLVFENDRVFLLNPTIRETKELAKLNAFDRMGTFSYGFGFDFSTNDYKVVRAARPYFDASSETEVEILELKSNIWRRIEGLESGIEIEGPGLFLHGALHWLGEKESDEEKFYELVPVPDHIEESKDHTLVLGISGDCLCLFYGYDCENVFEAWLLKEYGIKSSWSRLFSVHRDILHGYKYWENALCYTKTGKVLIDYDGRELVWYDPKEKTSKAFTPRNHWDWFQPAIYIESLVSPNCYRATNV
ncbi:F-box associated domain [Theobroma cacao]|nr:F-box associated domain [Theobroma cacao]